MKRIIALVLAVTLGGCSTAQQAQFQTGLTNANNFANKYGPLIAKDLIMVGNILYQMECSPGLAAGTAVAGNILNIVAPNSSAITKVNSVLNANVQIAQQLCPFVASIKASVGNVPQGAPVQVITNP